ncbi:hypothetical protein [uncultured Massilia sp.]|uniref:hypothetical protein n=1 Tax=uncultured Massilia sp. TaxID=169973 RepID=UPI0025DB304D|nr:hypothetical protein [uncultured Massilia sp.]
MLDLYLSELRRFRHGAAIYAAASLLALLLLNQLVDLPSAQIGFHLVVLLLYALSGLGFAVYQFASYRQPGRWIWLQHRPLHRAHILGAIVLAAATLIVLAMALPLFATLAALDHVTGRVVDTRHYAGAAWLALSTLSAWLAGGYIVLHRSRWAFLVLAVPLLLTMHLATWSTMLALALAGNAMLLFLLYTVFRPNRCTDGDAPGTAAGALALQIGLYLVLVWAGSMLFQGALMLNGAHPTMGDTAPRGGLVEMQRADRPEVFRAGLAASTDPRAGAWRTALDGRATAGLGPTVDRFAVRGVMTNRAAPTFVDGTDKWTFSHDRMMYAGHHLRTHAALGWLGTGGRGLPGPFDTQPVPARSNRGGGYLMTAHDLYDQEATGRLRHVLHIDGREQLGGGIAELGGRMLVLTNRRVLVLPAAAAASTAAPAQIALPRPFGELARADAAQVADGTLVSLVFGMRMLDGVAAMPQVVYLVDGAGRVSEVGRRELAHDLPVLFEHKDWWASPALHALTSLPALLVDTGTIPDEGASRFAPLLRERPAGVWAAAIAAAFVAGLAAMWWTRAARMTARARVAWCLACLLLGVPALLSLMVLQPRVRVRAVAAIEPAAAA